MAGRLSPSARPRHTGRRLASDLLTAVSGECPVCRSDAGRRAVFRIQSEPDVEFLECVHCHGCSASRMPTEATIDALYDGFYVQGEDQFTFHAPERLARHLVRHFASHLPTGDLRILEIGGGDGTLTRAIADTLQADSPALRVEVAEVELFQGEDRADERYAIRFHRDINETRGEFDVVVANACLHQIPDLHGVLAPMIERIRPGGLFYASTAWVLPLARLLGDRMDTLYPLHVHDLGSRFWNGFADTFGLSARILRSGPSLVETRLATRPLQALAAHGLKLPAKLELAFRPTGSDPLWTLVGGWEIFLRLEPASA